MAVRLQIRDVLAPDGKLLIDVMNRDWFLNQSGEPFGIEPHEFVVRNFDSTTGTTYLYEERFLPLTSRIQWCIRSIGEGSGERSTITDYRVYSAHELIRMLTLAGFEALGLHGDHDLSPFQVCSPHLICTAVKPRDR